MDNMIFTLQTVVLIIIQSLYMCHIAYACRTITMHRIRIDGSGTMENTTRVPFMVYIAWYVAVYFEVTTT